MQRRCIPFRGFTLLELMVVMSIIAIFLTIMIPTYSRSILVAHENQLRSELSQLREGIWRYTFDKQKAPQSLDDLKTAGYIDRVPDDPMTKEANWDVEEGEYLLSADQQDPGLIDVHSASNAIGTDGTAYSSW